MKGLLITHKGIEDIAALEIRELINKTTRISDTCIILHQMQDLLVRSIQLNHLNNPQKTHQ